MQVTEAFLPYILILTFVFVQSVYVPCIFFFLRGITVVS